MKHTPPPMPTYATYGDLKTGEYFRVAVGSSGYYTLQAQEDINFFKAADSLRDEHRVSRFVEDIVRRELARIPQEGELLDTVTTKLPIFSLDEHFITYDQASYYSSILGEYEALIPQHLHLRLAYYFENEIKTKNAVEPSGEYLSVIVEQYIIDTICAWREAPRGSDPQSFIKLFEDLYMQLTMDELSRLEEKNIKRHGFHMTGVFDRGSDVPGYLYTKGLGDKLGFELFAMQDELSLNYMATLFTEICNKLITDGVIKADVSHEVVDEDEEKLTNRYLFKKVDAHEVSAVLTLRLRKLTSDEYPDLYQVHITTAKGKLPGEPGYRTRSLSF